MSRTQDSTVLLMKVQQPVAGRFHVPRQRLLALLDALGKHPVGLVCAPAGYGKTTALAELCAAWESCVAWISLDAGDNDPARLAAHLWASFQMDKLEESVFGHSLENVLARIANHLLQTDCSTLLVLDDYHLITALEVHAAVNLLLDNLPPALHVLIGSRSDPPLQLSRLRVKDRLVELRAVDLRFTPDEVRAFCEKALSVTPTESTMTLLENAIEGWAAGLQLAALHLRKTTPTHTDKSIAAFAASMTGDALPVFDYLADEVLAQQPVARQDFLLATSILNRFSGDLCQAVSGESAASHHLRELERAGLFLIPFDERHEWFRYHHLFADFLRARLQDTLPEQVTDLHRRAARWYADHGDVREAMHHAFAAGDLDLAADLFVRQGWDELTPRGELRTLWEWAERFSPEVLSAHPRLLLYVARLCQLIGESDRGQVYLQQAVKILAGQDDSDPVVRGDRAILASYQALYAVYGGDPHEALRLAGWADEHAPTDDRLFHVRQANTFGFIYYILGEVEAGRRAYTRAMALARQAQHHYLLLDSAFFLSVMNVGGGALRDIKTLCTNLLDEYGEDFGPVCSVMAPLAYVYTERGQPAEGQRLCERALELARRERLPEVEWAACIVLAMSLLAQGDEAPAEVLFVRAERAASAVGSRVVLSISLAFKARFWLAAGQVTAATAWADAYLAAPPPDFPADVEQIALADVLSHTGHRERALEQLDELLESARPAKRLGHILEAQVIRATILEHLGRHTEADAALAEALQIGELEGYYRTFVNAGPVLLPILRRVEQAAPTTVHRLLRLFDDQPDPDALTERELEVLTLIADGASNQDIATLLVISVGTVKSHVNHLMAKLDVRNRTEAVARAREKSLLL